jgi:hypothetical protein
MKHLKAFENFEDNFKKYPNLFNLLVDVSYLDEEYYSDVNELMNDNNYKDFTIPTIIQHNEGKKKHC